MSNTLLAIDTNILLYALNADCPEQSAARAFLHSRHSEINTVLSELVLVELYVLLRNPKVLAHPMDGSRAAALVQRFRQHPHWMLVDHVPEIMDALWRFAGTPGFRRGRIFDLRLALGLQRYGVTSVATRNVADFQDLGFEQVFDPLIPSAPC